MTREGEYAQQNGRDLSRPELSFNKVIYGSAI